MGCAICALRSTDHSPYPELRFGGYRGDYVFPKREFLYCGTREIGYILGLVGKAVTGVRPIHSFLAPPDSCVLSTGVALTQYVSDYRSFAEEIPFCFIPFQ